MPRGGARRGTAPGLPRLPVPPLHTRMYTRDHARAHGRSPLPACTVCTRPGGVVVESVFDAVELCDSAACISLALAQIQKPQH